MKTPYWKLPCKLSNTFHVLHTLETECPVALNDERENRTIAKSMGVLNSHFGDAVVRGREVI
jgi:hypothetical protein